MRAKFFRNDSESLSIPPFGSKAAKVIATIALSLVGVMAQAQSWAGGTLSHSTFGPYDDGAGGTFTTYDSWIYTDPQGRQHSFSIETEKDQINIGPGKYRIINSSAEGLSSDGLYALKAIGSSGTVGLQVTVQPRFQVLSIMYAPPGSHSNVNYSSGSSMGTTTSISNSFSNSSGLSVNFGASVGVFGAGTTLSSTWTKTQQNSIQETTAKGTNGGYIAYGPADSMVGIDHNYDVIMVWLNPQLNLRAYTQSSATWDESNNALDPASNGGTEVDVIPVYAYMLKDPSQMPSNVADRLRRAWAGPDGALTTTDYATILARDPFANGSAYIDPNRFISIASQTFPYVPPPSGGQPITAYYNLTKSSGLTTGSTFTDQFTTSISNSIGIKAILSASYTGNNSWTWINSNTYSNSSATSQQASLSITGPQTGYTGPTNLQVYWDSVYNTFMFSLIQ